ncbi:MAG: hypothetical protein WCI51_07245 [Lentisphaerota bacterium]
MSNPSKIKITIELDATKITGSKELIEQLTDVGHEITCLAQGDCESTEFNLYDSEHNMIGHCMAESVK